VASSIASALSAAIPAAEKSLGVLRATPYQELRRLPTQSIAELAHCGRRVTLTTYVEVFAQHGDEVQVVIQLVAHGWLGINRVWAQGFRATHRGVRRRLRKAELRGYT
jgi:hypothetical protein